MARKLIFDLDRTLWRATVEYHKRMRIPPISCETYNVLRYLNQRNYEMHIASRSKDPEKCNIFLDNCFPDIAFKKRAIYYTPFSKLNHILDLGCQKGDFIIFDDEPRILKTIQKVYPNCETVLCNNLLGWNNIVKLNL